MKKLLAVLLIISVLSLTGCLMIEQMYEPVAQEPAEETTQSAVDDIETSIDEIDDLEQELDLSELDDLEQELDALDW